MAAASARLCVETALGVSVLPPRYAAASARLCVETLSGRMDKPCITAAASARLCVETAWICSLSALLWQPPPRGCVLKLKSIEIVYLVLMQPPPRGCVLKLSL